MKVLKETILDSKDICAGLAWCPKPVAIDWHVTFPKPKPTKVFFNQKQSDYDDEIIEIGLTSDVHLDELYQVKIYLFYRKD